MIVKLVLVQTAILAAVALAEFECPSEIGLFPKPGDCKSFYKCFAWEAGLVQCPGDLLFHPVHKLCDWKDNVDCDESARAISTPSNRGSSRGRFKSSRDNYPEDYPKTRTNKQYSESRSSSSSFFGKSASTFGRNQGTFGYTQVKSHESKSSPKVKSKKRKGNKSRRVLESDVNQIPKSRPKARIEAIGDAIIEEFQGLSSSHKQNHDDFINAAAEEDLSLMKKIMEMTDNRKVPSEQYASDVNNFKPVNIESNSIPKSEVEYTIEQGSAIDPFENEVFRKEPVQNIDTNVQNDIDYAINDPEPITYQYDDVSEISSDVPLYSQQKDSEAITHHYVEDYNSKTADPVYRYPKDSNEYFSVTEYLLYTPIDEILSVRSSDADDFVVLRIPKSSPYNPFKSASHGSSPLPKSSPKHEPSEVEPPPRQQGHPDALLLGGKPARSRNFQEGDSSLQSGFYGFKPIRITSEHDRHRDYNPLAKFRYAEGSCDKIGKSREPINREIKLLRQKACSASNTVVEEVSPGSSSNPANVKIVESIFSAQDFKEVFPKANKAYTYENFLKAFAKFPEVCKSREVCKKTLATMFAHFEQETWGLYYIEEITKSDYCASHTEWIAKAYPCAHRKQYYGRGSKQLSWNYNYGAFSLAMFGDAKVLLENPDLVASTWLNFASAIWFYLTPQPPKPSMLAVVDGSWQPNDDDYYAYRDPGFGATTMIINGALECGADPPNKTASKNRQKHYRRFATYFNIDIRDEKLDCADMEPFDATSSSNPNIYWAPETGCKLAQWQTAYSALVEGDFERCQRDS